MMTSSGVGSLAAKMSFSPQEFSTFKSQQSASLDPVRSFTRLKQDSLDTKQRLEFDSTKDIIETPGFLQKIGAEHIFISETTNFHKFTPSFSKQVSNKIICVLFY